MGAEAHFDGEMRNLDSFCCCVYKILVVIGKMVDVDKRRILLDLLIRMTVDGVEVGNIFLRVEEVCTLSNYWIYLPLNG